MLRPSGPEVWRHAVDEGAGALPLRRSLPESVQQRQKPPEKPNAAGFARQAGVPALSSGPLPSTQCPSSAGAAVGVPTSAPAASAVPPSPVLPLLRPRTKPPSQPHPPGLKPALCRGGRSHLPLFWPRPSFSSLQSLSPVQPVQGNVLQPSDPVLRLPVSRVLRRARTPGGVS